MRMRQGCIIPHKSEKKTSKQYVNSKRHCLTRKNKKIVSQWWFFRSKQNGPKTGKKKKKKKHSKTQVCEWVYHPNESFLYMLLYLYRSMWLLCVYSLHEITFYIIPLLTLHHIHTSMYVYTCIYILIYIYMCVYIYYIYYICIYIYIHVCVCVMNHLKFLRCTCTSKTHPKLGSMAIRESGCSQKQNGPRWGCAMLGGYGHLKRLNKKNPWWFLSSQGVDVESSRGPWCWFQPFVFGVSFHSIQSSHLNHHRWPWQSQDC